MHTSTQQNTIIMSSNELTCKRRIKVHIKVSNFLFGIIVIRSTDQRENSEQTGINNIHRKDLREIKGHTQAECLKVQRGRAPSLYVVVPHSSTAACLGLKWGRASSGPGR